MCIHAYMLGTLAIIFFIFKFPAVLFISIFTIFYSNLYVLMMNEVQSPIALVYFHNVINFQYIELFEISYFMFTI